MLPQFPECFPFRGFEALFPHTGILGCAVCLAPQLFLLFYPHANVGLTGLPAATFPAQVHQPPLCHVSSSPWLPVSTPPTRLDECFFFNFFVVGLPYSSTFCQFWLFYAFKFVVVPPLVVWGGESKRKQCRFLGSLPGFSSFLCYPQVDWDLLVLIPGWVGLCMF